MAGRKRAEIKKIDLANDAAKAEALQEWYKIDSELKALKIREAELRTSLVASMFDAAKIEGVETVDIGNGWQLKSTKCQNYRATNVDHQTEALLNAIGIFDPGAASGLVKWSPDLSIKVYREVLAASDLHPEIKPLLSAAITVTPGMPQLEMVAPDEPTVPAAS